MNDQDKARRQEEQERKHLKVSAFTMAEYQNKDNPEIKKAREEVNKAQSALQEHRELQQKLQRSYVKALSGLEDAVKPFVAEELRD